MSNGRITFTPGDGVSMNASTSVGQSTVHVTFGQPLLPPEPPPAGVREPRRPLPSSPPTAIALEAP